MLLYNQALLLDGKVLMPLYDLEENRTSHLDSHILYYVLPQHLQPPLVSLAFELLQRLSLAMEFYKMHTFDYQLYSLDYHRQGHNYIHYK